MASKGQQVVKVTINHNECNGSRARTQGKTQEGMTHHRKVSKGPDKCGPLSQPKEVPIDSMGTTEPGKVLSRKDFIKHDFLVSP